MKKPSAAKKQRELTPVDDVRRIREQFDREAGGDISLRIEQTRLATEKWIKKLGLKIAAPPGSATETKAKRLTGRRR